MIMVPKQRIKFTIVAFFLTIIRKHDSAKQVALSTKREVNVFLATNTKKNRANNENNDCPNYNLAAFHNRSPFLAKFRWWILRRAVRTPCIKAVRRGNNSWIQK